MRGLTVRQEQVLRMLADGLCDKQISDQLGLAKDTVKDHAHMVVAKLGARNRTHAVSIAYRMGLIKMEAA